MILLVYAFEIVKISKLRKEDHVIFIIAGQFVIEKHLRL